MILHDVRQIFRASFILVTIAAALAAQPLETALRDRFRDFPGTVTLYAKNLDSGAAIGIRETDPVRTVRGAR